MTDGRATAIKIFYCYAHEDRALLDELEKHISPLRRLKQVTGWFDRDILAGTDWANEIEMQINAASIILLLVSPDFINSDYCYSVEMKRALERHETKAAQVIPIILRPVFWEETPIGNLQVLPTAGKPITQWSDRDAAFLDVARGVSKVVKMLLSREVLSQQETSLIEQIGRLTQPSKTALKAVERPQPALQVSGKQPEIYALDPMIGGRYQLKRLIKQGEYCAVYQGFDQSLHRKVAVKAIPATQVSIYRAAVRMTSQFSYPNIVDLYDLVAKPDRLYLVQEYIEGDDFAALLQAPLQPYDVAEIGRQICSALIYASSSSRRVCHGDLTPAAILRDQRGLIRVNNFALPSDSAYFQRWNTMGRELGKPPSSFAPLSDTNLPWGQWSEERSTNDTRAVGLLLYQLLTSRPPSATLVEPSPDGHVRFPRTVPAELCEIVARILARQHPQHINTPDALFEELTWLAKKLEY